jgi:PIN domain nuclease of toxin-antitoxin system
LRLLLDTHVAIWALASPELLTDKVRDLVGDPRNAVFVSAASVWEIAIKHALAKRGAPPFSGAEAIGYFREAGYLLLDVRAEHAAGVETLPSLHGDPFDRLIVAQALEEPLRLVTHDPKVAAYSDTIICF